MVGKLTFVVTSIPLVQRPTILWLVNLRFVGQLVSLSWLAHAKEPLEPLAHVRPDFPVAVADVIERLLEKDQGKRFQSSSELLDAVEPLIAKRAPPSRTAVLPLSWNPETAFGLKFSKDYLAKSTFSASQIQSGTSQHANTVASATAMLKASLDREEIDKLVSRRVWAVTGALAAFGVGVGFFIGRRRLPLPGRRPPTRPRQDGD